MQSRLAIVLMSVAGAGLLFCVGLLFGLGVMSTPSPEQHKQIAVTTTPTKVARQETTGSATHDDRALTPIYPARPAGADTPPAAKAEPAQQSPAPPQQQAAQKPTQEPQQPTPQQAQAAAPPPPTQQAKADVSPAASAKPVAAAPVSPPKAATPVSLQTRNACDVQACASAYRSFRESDCTYQPYSGPRQVCVSPPGAREASRSREPERLDRGDLRARASDVREDRRVDEPEFERAADRRDESRRIVLRYHRDYTAGGEDDRVVVPADADRGDWADDRGDDDDQ